MTQTTKSAADVFGGNPAYDNLPDEAKQAFDKMFDEALHGEIKNRMEARLKAAGHAYTDVVLVLAWTEITTLVLTILWKFGVPASAYTDADLDRIIEYIADDFADRVTWDDTLAHLIEQATPPELDPEGNMFSASRETEGGRLRITTPLVWTCNCNPRRLHPRSEDHCPDCGIRREDVEEADPDYEEIIAGKDDLPEDLVNFIVSEARKKFPTIQEKA